MGSYVISYDRNDSDFVRSLVSIMKRDNLDVWFDRDIDYGEPFSRVIKREIDTRDEVIVLWSPHSIDSHWVENEAAYALNQKKLRPACINGLHVTDVPLGFYALNTFTFEDDKPDYLRRAVRQFLNKRELGIARTADATAKKNQNTGRIDGKRNTFPAWAAIPLCATAFGLSGFAGDQLGLNSRKLKSAEERYASAEREFLDQYEVMQQADTNLRFSREELLRWAAYVHSQMFEGSDLLSQKITKMEQGKEDFRNLLENNREEGYQE